MAGKRLLISGVIGAFDYKFSNRGESLFSSLGGGPASFDPPYEPKTKAAVA
jgi:hypothetical protein